MRVKRETCRNCGGYGKLSRYVVDSVDEASGVISATNKESVCPDCKGNGYIDYAVFSVDEAKAILEHCGLTED